MKNFRFAGLAALVMLLVTTVFAYATAHATVMEQVEKDFAPVAGIVVMAAGADTYIIDLDGSSGLVVGDLLAVVEEGAPIVHPVTKKILGTLDKPVAVLRVTQVKGGYSYANVVDPQGDSVTIGAGAKLKRYSNLSAAFRDEVGGHEAMYVGLRRALPQLEWQESVEGPAAKLFFNVTPNGLEVRDAESSLIRAYAPEPGHGTGYGAVRAIPTNAITSPVSTPARPATTLAVVAPTAAVLATGATSGANVQMGAIAPPQGGQSDSAVKYEAGGAQPQSASRTSNVFNMEFPQFNKVGQFKKKTVMADFERVGGKLLLAASDGGAIDVYVVGEGLEQIVKGDSTTMGQILALSWYQPQPGETYLVVTVWSDNRINTDLLKLEGNRLQTIVSGYSKMVAGFDLDGDMRSELLLAQEFDRENFYGRRVEELKLLSGAFKSSPVPLTLPNSFQIFGALLTDVTGDGQIEAVFVRNRRLHVFKGTEQIYKSGKEMGGSVSTISYDIDPDAKYTLINNVSFEVAPIAADLDGDGVREIIAVAADGNILRNVGVASAIDSSWLAVFKYQNGMVIKGTIGDKLERPLQGLAIANGQAYMLATDVGSLLDSSESSYLLSIPLQ
ncbi:MAG: hypothetical protein PHH87_04475 [Desulfuromonas sp.]|nr:hypothetical protein [Desulfuromonas sp.]